MTERQASCSCGQLRLWAQGDPIRVSVCHCIACQRRTGSAFGFNARFPRERVRISGRTTEYIRVSDEGEPRAYHFCPDCGATVYYLLPSAPELVAVPAGVFGDPNFPPPTVSVWEWRKHHWVELPAHVERPG